MSAIPRKSLYKSQNFPLNLRGECVLFEIEVEIWRYGGTNNPQFCFEVIRAVPADEHRFVRILLSGISCKHKPEVDKIINQALNREIRESIFSLYYNGTIENIIALGPE